MQPQANVRQRAVKFSIDIISFCKSLPNTRIYWAIVDQLLRSATSVGANLIEAQAASSKRDFIKFFQIALKSANETRYWLYLLSESDLEEIDRGAVSELKDELEQICSIIAKSLITMKNRG